MEPSACESSSLDGVIIRPASALHRRVAPEAVVHLVPAFLRDACPCPYPKEIRGAQTFLTEIAGPAGCGKSTFLISLCLDRLINRWFEGSPSSVVYVATGVEGKNNVVAVRVQGMARAALRMHLELVEVSGGLEELVAFYNEHPETSGALPPGASLEDLHSAMVESVVMKNFVYLHAKTTEEFQAVLGVTAADEDEDVGDGGGCYDGDDYDCAAAGDGGGNSSSSTTTTTNRQSDNGAQKKKRKRGQGGRSPPSGTIQSILLGKSCDLIVVDSIAALYRQSYSEESLSPVELTSMLFKVACGLRRLPGPVVVSNQVTAGEGDNTWKASLGQAWSNCVERRILVDRVMNKDNAWIRWAVMGGRRYNFKIYPHGVSEVS